MTQPKTTPSAESMSEAQLQAVNERWEGFYREKKWLLEFYARHDEDLVSVGLLSVRESLCKDIDCPVSWLLRRAYLDMLKERGRGSSIGIQKLAGVRKHPLSRDDIDVNSLGTDPEIGILDHLQYEAFWNDLTPVERKLVHLLKEEKGEYDKHFYEGEYIPVERVKGKPRTRFHEEVSPSVTVYKTAYAQARFKFFLHFGSEQEIEREHAWLENWKPNMSLHVSRNGKCART